MTEQQRLEIEHFDEQFVDVVFQVGDVRVPLSQLLALLYQLLQQFLSTTVHVIGNDGRVR